MSFMQVLGTHYLELYSDKAQVETDKAITMEFLKEGQKLLRLYYSRGSTNIPHL